ncbi:equilibrative nucleoside transporter 1-like isoform X2 [Styela clava]
MPTRKRVSFTEVGEWSGEDVENINDVEYLDNPETPLLPHNNTMAPKDRYSVSYFIFYLLGLGSLLPWNFFITANDYWMYKLRDVNNTVPESAVTPLPNEWNITVPYDSNSTSTTPGFDPGTITSLQSLFMNSLAICAMLPNVIFQFLNTLLQKRIPQNVRVLFTLGAMILLFVFTEVLVRTDTSTWQNEFFTITLISVVLINSFSAVFQSSVFGVAACFPQKYSGCVMAGQGMGGVFAALAMIAALAFSSDPTDSAFIFFLTAIVVLALTMVFYVVLINQEFYKFFALGSSNKEYLNDKDVKLNTSGNNSEEKHPLAINGDEGDDSWMKREIEDRNGINKYPSSESSISADIKTSSSSPSLMLVVKKIWLHMFCVVYTFFITLSCYPAVTARIKSMSSGTSWNDLYFTPVCCFLLFNLADWVGRTSASYIHIPSSDSKCALLLGVLARTIFPFLFALCNFQPRYHLPVWFANDAFFIVFMILFALSNGHLSTLCMQYGPKQVSPENAATAGSLLAFMISVGLLAGAGSSFLVVALI